MTNYYVNFHSEKKVEGRITRFWYDKRLAFTRGKWSDYMIIETPEGRRRRIMYRAGLKKIWEEADVGDYVIIEKISSRPMGIGEYIEFSIKILSEGQ